MQKRSCNPPKKREKSKSTGIRECYIRKLEPPSAKTKTSPCSVMWAVTKVHTIVGEIRGPDEQLMETDEKTQIKRNLRTHKKTRDLRGGTVRGGGWLENGKRHTHTPWTRVSCRSRMKNAAVWDQCGCIVVQKNGTVKRWSPSVSYFPDIHSPTMGPFYLVNLFAIIGLS